MSVDEGGGSRAPTTACVQIPKVEAQCGLQFHEVEEWCKDATSDEAAHDAWSRVGHFR
jgi:hypothetical protein